MYTYINIDKFDSERRIDNWMFSNFKNVPKSAIYKMIRKGNIRINNTIILPHYKLKYNDLIRINKLIYNNNLNDNKNIIINDYFKPNNLKKNILYEDEHLLVINKPSGISVHNSNNFDPDVISNLRFIYNKNYELIHRLDKYTSGILLIAKNKYILRILNNQFYKKNIFKKYIILVCGIWNKKIKIVDLPIYKIKSNNKRYISTINKLGKKSISIFNIKEYFNNMTLLEVNIITGRMHQIRVHASFLNNPVALDNIYGNKKINNKLLSLGLKRIFIHSNNIIFIHPTLNKKISILSPIDSDLSRFLKILNKNK